MADISTIFHNIGELLVYSPDSPMLFSSGLFWALFLVFLPLYAMLKSSRVKMTVFVVVFSLFFYYKSSGWFLLLLLATSLVDWIISRLMIQTGAVIVRRCCVAVSVVVSLSVLCYFKYANFFLWNWNQMVEGNYQPFDIILPVGISFYTFQSISYIVDVYRGDVTPTESWFDYLFFLSFFPALVAGPIVRANYFIPQIKENRRASRTDVFGGFWLVVVGVVKKAIIADYISQYNDLIFASPTGYSGFESLMGVIGYTMQIYCDFSGYSDMAIGIALIMGFNLSVNFDFPYQSTSLSEFWHRWHISLSSWLRDYVYIPLGGNRRGTVRTYVNNFLTMLIGGLWHGAAWKFVFWGAMHGVGLAVNKACRPLTSRLESYRVFRVTAWLITIIYVSLLWVFFRADSWSDSWMIIGNIFSNFSVAHIIPFFEARYVWVAMMVLIIISHAIPRHVYNSLAVKFVESPWIVKLFLFVVVVQLVVEFAGEDVAPFIYFQF